MVSGSCLGLKECGDARVGGDGRAEDDGARGGEAGEAGGDPGGVAEVVEVVVDGGDQHGAAVDADAQAQAAGQVVRRQGGRQLERRAGRRPRGSANEPTTPSPTVLTGAPPCVRRQPLRSWNCSWMALKARASPRRW